MVRDGFLKQNIMKQTLLEHLNAGGTVQSFVEQERKETNKNFKFWIFTIVTFSVIILTIQTEIIYNKSKSITYLKHQNSLDSANNYSNETDIMEGCKKMSEKYRQDIYDSIMKQHGFNLEDLNSEHNKKVARRNWTTKDYKYNKEGEDEKKNKN